MINIVREFDSQFNASVLKQNLKFFENNLIGPKDVPYGVYDVEIVKLKLVKSKIGYPMVDVCFKIDSGEYKNCVLNTNYIVADIFGLQACNIFLQKISKCLVKFVSFAQYNKQLLNIKKNLKNKRVFKLKYSMIKGFKKYQIL